MGLEGRPWASWAQSALVWPPCSHPTLSQRGVQPSTPATQTWLVLTSQPLVTASGQLQSGRAPSVRSGYEGGTLPCATPGCPYLTTVSAGIGPCAVVASQWQDRHQVVPQWWSRCERSCPGQGPELATPAAGLRLGCVTALRALDPERVDCALGAWTEELPTAGVPSASVRPSQSCFCVRRRKPRYEYMSCLRNSHSRFRNFIPKSFGALTNRGSRKAGTVTQRRPLEEPGVSLWRARGGRVGTEGC